MIEGTVAEWLVKEGDTVKKGDLAMSFENEKTNMECECLADGIIHLVAKVGDVVKVGETIAILAESPEEYEMLLAGTTTKMEEPQAKPKEAAIQLLEASQEKSMTSSKKTDRVKSTGLARSIAGKNQVDMHLIVGSGPDGRVRARDVDAYLNEEKGKVKITQVKKEEPTKTMITPIRRAIANNLRKSIDTMVQASSSTEFDVTELFALRAKLVEQQEEIGWKITINDLLVMASVKVLEKHPLLNATFDGSVITSYPYVDINVAVATETGLAIPVVRGTEKMTLLELSKALRDVAVRAREGALKPGEQASGSFTVSNIGMYPIDTGTPIANAPQVGLFAFGRPVDKWAKHKGEFGERKMMNAIITFDHRVFDGMEQGLIMRDLQSYLEHPERMLI